MSLVELNNNFTDKNTLHSYLPLYDELLKPIKEKCNNLLEIGVLYGGSTKLWYDFFPNAHIYGIDVKDNIKIPEIKTYDRVKLNLNQNAYDYNFVKNNFNEKKFDLILDDGPHTLISMVQFIAFYSNLLSDNGILIIEDVQNWEWIETLKAVTPESLKKYIRIYDLRKNKNRYDDIVFTVDKINKKNDQKEVFELETGFIILRHVTDEKTGKYWIKSYEHIREFFPKNKIMIIDDNSNYKFIDKEYEKSLHSVTVVKSEFPGRGEILPYYYYLKLKPFKKVCIIHDSVFLNSKINLKVDNYKFLWHFNHHADQENDETRLLKVFNNEDILKFHKDKNLWVGCFGSMCIITYEYLKSINNKYNISSLIDHIKTRYNRCSFERVIACLLQINNNQKSVSLFGDILKYCRYGGNNYDEYKHLPVIKIWSGR
jgi:hypothetical protein